MIVPLIGFGMPGGYEWLIVLLILVLLFGASRIPDVARGLGSGISEFKKGLKEVDSEVESGEEPSETSESHALPASKEKS